MLICETCKKKGHRCAPNPDGTCGVYEKKIMTNFERIKAMSVEEMAKEIHNLYDGGICKNACNNLCEERSEKGCTKKIRKWLESEATE